MAPVRPSSPGSVPPQRGARPDEFWGAEPRLAPRLAGPGFALRGGASPRSSSRLPGNELGVGMPGSSCIDLERPGGCGPLLGEIPGCWRYCVWDLKGYVGHRAVTGLCGAGLNFIC